MKKYNLYSIDNSISYFLGESSTDTDDEPIDVVISVSELIPHTQYKIFLTKTSDGSTKTMIVDEHLINTSNLTNLGISFLNGSF